MLTTYLLYVVDVFTNRQSASYGSVPFIADLFLYSYEADLKVDLKIERGVLGKIVYSLFDTK